MFVKWKEVEFVVAFRHADKMVPAPKWTGSEVNERRVTTCSIMSMETGTELGVGEAILHPRDKFSRPKGRKLALARALQRLGSRRVVELSSAEPEVKMTVVESKKMISLRKAFWDAFFANKPTGMQLPAYDETAGEDEQAA
jgi:hypothetical protein